MDQRTCLKAEYIVIQFSQAQLDNLQGKIEWHGAGEKGKGPGYHDAFNLCQ
jgi:hypothetical protein